MNTPPPPPDDSYVVMLGKDVPKPMPLHTLYFEGPANSMNGWVNSIYAGREAGYIDDDWYAVPKSAMPKEKPASSTISGPLTQQIGGDHYKSFAIQPAEFIIRNKLSFLEGCVIKRVCRHRAKNGAEDIRKAMHELALILELEYGEKA